MLEFLFLENSEKAFQINQNIARFRSEFLNPLIQGNKLWLIAQ